MYRHQSRIRRLEKRHARQAKTEKRIPRNPVVFARSLGIEPDPWQRDLLTSTDEYIMLNCSRQSGKSTIVAILALYHLLTKPMALVLILSPSQRQSGELFRKIVTLYRKLGKPGGSVIDSVTTLELENGSRIVSLPGSESTTRGYSAPSLVLVDEAAQVSEALYETVRPMFAVSRGQLIFLSTPRGKRGLFWRVWEEDPGWKKVKVTADQCPRIAQDFLDRERRALGESLFAQEYFCEFVQQEDSVFKEEWLCYYDPDKLPQMDTVIQSWDTANTKSATSDYVVGQVWGKAGASFYLLDQVHAKLDFRETMDEIKALSKKWPEALSKLVEAQTLGAALSSVLKREVVGIIPIDVRISKVQRAHNCLPLWQAGNVYLPKPETATWMRDYLRELLNFPQAQHDDCVDATTLALNQWPGGLFPSVKDRLVPITNVQPVSDHEYVIGWVPAHRDDETTVVVYDQTTNAVARFVRFQADPLLQIDGVHETSRAFNWAIVRAIDGYKDALLHALEMKGTYVKRVKFTKQKFTAACDNLSMLVSGRLVDIPDNPELVAELEVFKPNFAFEETPDYSLQVAQQSAIVALCLVTHDLDPSMWEYHPSIYCSFDPDLIDPPMGGYWRLF